MAAAADDPIPYTTYIHGLDPDVSSRVMGWRLRAQEQIDGVTEALVDGRPALTYRGEPLMSLIVSGDGYALTPFSPTVFASAVAALDGFSTSDAGVEFTQDHQIPLAVFDRMLKDRKAEIDAALDAKKS